MTYLTRRSFTYVAAVSLGKLLLDTTPELVYAQSRIQEHNTATQSLTSPGCTKTFDQVKYGLISPKEYIKEMEDCLPEVAAARNSGQLKGFLYEIPPHELEPLLRNLFRNAAQNKEHLGILVETSLRGYKEFRPNEVARIVPGVFGVIGRKIPMYIIFKKHLFSGPHNGSDEDFKAVVRHELEHVADFYNGIRLGNLHLSYPSLSPKQIKVKFLEQLIELRAEHKDLKFILKSLVETGRLITSDMYIGSQASNYAEHWHHIRNNPSTDLERRIGEIQLEEFKDIIPLNMAGKFYIQFELSGKKYPITIEPVK